MEKGTEGKGERKGRKEEGREGKRKRKGRKEKGREGRKREEKEKEKGRGEKKKEEKEEKRRGKPNGWPQGHLKFDGRIRVFFFFLILIR